MKNRVLMLAATAFAGAIANIKGARGFSPKVYTPLDTGIPLASPTHAATSRNGGQRRTTAQQKRAARKRRNRLRAKQHQHGRVR